MLSLSPRYDLFRFLLPDDFLPEEVEEKYKKILDRNAGVITTPINYLNESIQGITFPGITQLTMTQQQHESNPIKRNQKDLGRINVEPTHEMVYQGSENPLAKIDRELKVTFRFNQGLYNYFMIYETIFHRYLKDKLEQNDPVFTIDIMDETGHVVSRIKLFDVHLDGIDGIDFNYNKVDRDSGTFEVLFKFNNIDYVFVSEDGKEL